MSNPRNASSDNKRVRADTVTGVPSRPFGEGGGEEAREVRSSTHYSMTDVARTMISGGRSMPSIFAAFRFDRQIERHWLVDW